MKSRGFGAKATAVRFRQVLATLLGICLLVSTPAAFAEGSDVTTTVQFRGNGSVRSVQRGLNLNLSSTRQSIRVGSDILGGNSAAIEMAGTIRTIQAGDRITAAEFVALQQQLGGGQSIVLDNAGRATGGTFAIDAVAAQANASSFRNLVVPAGVMATNNFAGDSTLSLRGNLTNLGTLLGFSNSESVVAGTFAARNINNVQGALISSALPSSLALALGSVVTDFALNLSAIKNIINAGTISSAGNLSITAGGTITNVSTTATISAASNVNLFANSIVNSGLIQSVNNNVNFANLGVADLMINNSGGRIEALLGAINVRDSLYAGANNITLFGGDFLSKELNLYSGTGAIEANIGQVTGQINSSASLEHITAATDNLLLGTHCITGDPTYYNTAGTITLTGPITVAEALTIVARDDITSNAAVAITAVSGAGVGQAVTLVAGANITSTSGGGNQSSVGPIPPPNAGNGGLTFAGASANGGQVVLASGSSITTSSTTANNAGGVIRIAAFGGGTATSGTVTLNGVDLTANGAGTGAGGAVTIVGGQNGNTVTVGSVTSTSAQGNGGSVTITAAQPTSGAVTFAANGSLTSGSIAADLSTRATAGDVVLIGNITTDGGNGASGAAGSGAAGGAGGSGGPINVMATTGIAVDGNLSATGGDGGAGGSGADGLLGGSPGGPGGGGGSGGTSGGITLANLSGLLFALPGAALDTSGGDGGNGGSGGTATLLFSGGAGGAASNGGNAGAITLINAAGPIVFERSFTAVGGDGGAGGDGGSGGILGSGGAGGNGATGGTGGPISITTTNSGTISITGNINSSGGGNGAGGAGGAAGALGTAGAPGTPGNFGQPGSVTVRTTTSALNAGAAVGINGFIQAVSNIDDLSTILAGAGAITLAGRTVAVFGPVLTVGGTDYSIYGGSSITITAAGGSVVGTNYSSNGDLTSLLTQPITLTGTPFLAVDPSITAFGDNGTSNALATRTGGAITINSLAQSNPLTTQTSIGGGTLVLTIAEGSGSRALTNGSLVTPAELIAAIQVSTLPNQDLELNSSGQAVGGEFELADENLPIGGTFSVILIPQNVTENITTTGPVVSTSTVGVFGTMNFNNAAGVLTATSNIVGSGLIAGSAPTLDVTSTAGSIGGGGFTLTINNPTLTLMTSGGSIGSLANNIFTDASTLTASTGGGANSSSVFITDTFEGTVTLSGLNQAGSGIGGMFFLNANNPTESNIITDVASFISAANIVLNAAFGDIGTDFGFPLSGVQILGPTNFTGSAPNGSVYVQSDNSIDLRNFGSFTNNAFTDYQILSTGSITASTGASITTLDLNLESTVGNIGADLLPINTNAALLVANAPNGSVFINNTSSDGVEVYESSTADIVDGTFRLIASGDISSDANADISGNIVVLTSTGGGLSLGGDVSGTTSVSLTASDNIVNSDFTGTITTPVLNLTSTNGSIGPSNISRFLTNAAQVTANAPNGDVFLESTALGGVALGPSGANTSFGTFDLLSAETITQTSGVISAATVSLTTTAGDIGTGIANILTSAGNLKANAGGTGSVFITETDAVNVQESSAGDVFSLKAAGNITISGAVVAPEVRIETTNGSNANITIGDDIGQALGAVFLTSDGNGGILHTAGTIFGDSAVLASEGGTIGTALNPLESAVADLSANTGGTGSVFINQTGAVFVQDSSAGVNFKLVGTDDISLGSVNTLTGFITAQTSTGLLEVRAGKDVVAGVGNLTLQNLDTLAGQILLQPNSVLVSGSNGVQHGDVIIVVGAIPNTPILGVAPGSVSATITNGGQIFWGANSVLSLPPTNVVTANRARVVFSTGSLPASAITLAGGVRINAPGSPLLRSLDLTDPNVALFIRQQQQFKIFGGKLKVNSIGQAIKGKVVLSPENLAPTLSAENIPFKVKLQLKNFTANTPIKIQLGSNSTTQQVLINGTHQYLGKVGVGVINVTSALGGTVFNLGSTGKLIAKTSLAINASGNVFIGGRITSKNIAITTTALSQGNITIAAKLGKGGASTTTLAADGTGDIIQTAGTIRGGILTLTSGGGDIGTVLAHIRTQAKNLFANTSGTGAVFVDNKGTMTLGSSSAGGSFNLTNAGTLTVGDISTEAGSIQLIQTTGGTLTVAPGAELNAVDGNITIQHVKPSSKAILIGTGAVIFANASGPPLGNVTIFVGPGPAQGVNPATPANVVPDIQAGGAIFYGTNSILALGSPNFVTAKGATVIFNTGTSSASAITLGGGVSITADPPVSLNAPVVVPFAVPLDATAGAGTSGAVTPRLNAQPELQSSVIPAGVAGFGAMPTMPARTDVSANSLIPIAYFAGAAAAHSNLSAVGRTDVAVRPATMDIASDSGEVLLAPDRDIIVRTTEGQLHVAAGAIVLVIGTLEATAVYNLHDTRQAAVKFAGAKGTLHVGTGRALIFMGGSAAVLPQRHLVRAVGYRKVKTMPLAGDTAIVTAEFSIPSALQSLPALQRLRTSADAKHGKVLSRIVKTAAVVSTIKGQSEPYRMLPANTVASVR